jgi:hypothetical protein
MLLMNTSLKSAKSFSVETGKGEEMCPGGFIQTCFSLMSTWSRGHSFWKNQLTSVVYYFNHLIFSKLCVQEENIVACRYFDRQRPWNKPACSHFLPSFQRVIVYGHLSTLLATVFETAANWPNNSKEFLFWSWKKRILPRQWYSSSRLHVLTIQKS